MPIINDIPCRWPGCGTLKLTGGGLCGRCYGRFYKTMGVNCAKATPDSQVVEAAQKWTAKEAAAAPAPGMARLQALPVPNLEVVETAQLEKLNADLAKLRDTKESFRKELLALQGLLVEQFEIHLDMAGICGPVTVVEGVKQAFAACEAEQAATLTERDQARTELARIDARLGLAQPATPADRLRALEALLARSLGSAPVLAPIRLTREDLERRAYLLQEADLIRQGTEEENPVVLLRGCSIPIEAEVRAGLLARAARIEGEALTV